MPKKSEAIDRIGQRIDFMRSFVEVMESDISDDRKMVFQEHFNKIMEAHKRSSQTEQKNPQIMPNGVVFGQPMDCLECQSKMLVKKHKGHLDDYYCHNCGLYLREIIANVHYGIPSEGFTPFKSRNN